MRNRCVCFFCFPIVCVCNGLSHNVELFHVFVVLMRERDEEHFFGYRVFVMIYLISHARKERSFCLVKML